MTSFTRERGRNSGEFFEGDLAGAVALGAAVFVAEEEGSFVIEAGDGAGVAARLFVESELGATERSVRLVQRLVRERI